MKKKYVSYIIAALAIFAAGCGAGSPSTPLQIPTTVEYLGGDVTGDIAVLTAQTVTFVAKDANGNDADASAVTVSLAKPDGTSADSDYGSCSTSTDNASYINCTGPDVLPSDVNPRVTYTFTGGASASISAGKDDPAGTPLGEYTGKIVVSPETVEGGAYTFTTLDEISGCNGASVSSNGAGWLFVVCMHVISAGNGTIMVYWSNADGENLQGPYEITGVANMNIIRAMKDPSNTENTASAILAYNVLNNAFKVVEISGNADGSITIGSTYTASNAAVYDAYYATDGTVHIIADMEDNIQCFYEPEDYIANAYYTKLSGGQFTSYSKINGTDCSVKATPGNEPKIAASGSGTIYAIWRSIGDSGQAEPSLISLYATKLSPTDGSVLENTAIFNPVTVEGTQWASGQNARIDKDGNLVASWDVSYVSGAAGSLSTNLSLFDDTGPFTSYPISALPILTSDIDNVLRISGTQVIPDYAGDYHMYYRNLGSLLYTLGSSGDNSTMSLTTPIAISSTDNLVTGFLSADADWSGKNFVAWQEQQGGGGSEIIVLAVGTTSQ